MSDLREAVARAVCDYAMRLECDRAVSDDEWGKACAEEGQWERILGLGDAVLALLRERGALLDAAAVRRAALEEAALVAEDHAPATQDMNDTRIAERCDAIAAAIRALAPTDADNGEGR